MFLFMGGDKRLEPLKELAKDPARQTQCAHFIPREHTHISLAAIDAHWLSLYSQFSALVFPSKFAGICAVRRPMIFVGVPQYTVGRMISENKPGLVVKNGDSEGFAKAAAQLAKDPELRQEMGDNACQFYLRTFSKEAGRKKWAELLSAS